MANYYGTVAGYKAYWDERSVAVLDDDEDITAALLLASEWIDGKYGSYWIAQAYKTGGRDQVRLWPLEAMTDVYGYALPSDAVPREVEWATYEVAKRQLAKPGSLYVDYTPSKYSQVSIDGAISVTFGGGGAMDYQLQIAGIDAILAPVLRQPGSVVLSGMSGRVVRV